MSVRAELVRLGLRWLMKSSDRPGIPLAHRRQRISRLERWVPKPPAFVAEQHGTLGGVPALHVACRSGRGDRQILFLHGGGFVAGSAALYRHISWRFAATADARFTAIDYRLAPEHPFPAALDDAMAAWRGLLQQGADPRQSVAMGDSAGGGLALALAMRLRDEGDPLPAAIVALSPWTDLALTGTSLRDNARADPMQNPSSVPEIAAAYLAGADPRNPYASPLYGDAAGLPPTLIQVGSDEILRCDAVRMAERMRAAGCAVELEIWPRMPHVWHAYAPLMPEARQAIERIGDFVRRCTAGGG